MSINVQKLINEPNANALINQFKDNTDPLYIGPGTWNVIHRLAYNARTKDQQLAYITLMKEICEGFPCDICKGHCKEYITNHPLEEYLNTNLDIQGHSLPLGMFIWSWKFHNAVNTRTKKPIMSWDTAYNLYSKKETLMCSKNCLAAGIHDQNNKSQSLTNSSNNRKMSSLRRLYLPDR